MMVIHNFTVAILERAIVRKWQQQPQQSLRLPALGNLSESFWCRRFSWYLVKFCFEDGQIWWATWRWNGWVRDNFTAEEWEEWEAHCQEQRAAAEESALAESAKVAAFFLGQERPDPLGR